MSGVSCHNESGMVNDEEQRLFLSGSSEDVFKRQSSPLEFEENNDIRKAIGISSWEAGFSLAKAIMGAGSFALPWAFSQMGYIAGPFFLTLLLGVSVYSLRLLVLCSRSTNKNSYVEVARSTFGNKGANMAYAASLSASIGVGGSYLVFISANLQSLLADDEDEEGFRISQTVLILLILPVAVMLSSVRDMKRFAMTSLGGDVAVILGMLVVLVYGISQTNDEPRGNLMAFGSLKTMPLAFGAIGYLFLVHFLCLPIESSMAHPEQFHSVAKVTFSLCALLSGGFGVIGYFLFGEETEQIVLMNVKGSFFANAVKILLCVDLLFTYPVVMRPSIAIVEQHWNIKEVSSHSKSGDEASAPSNTLGSWAWAWHFLVCLILGLVAAVGGIFVPAFGLLSGLVGGVSQTFLAMVLPPLMLNKLRQDIQIEDAASGTPAICIPLQRSKELGLVGVGTSLILWTLISTWNEVS